MWNADDVTFFFPFHLNPYGNITSRTTLRKYAAVNADVSDADSYNAGDSSDHDDDGDDANDEVENPFVPSGSSEIIDILCTRIPGKVNERNNLNNLL